MYLEIFLADFAVFRFFREFRGISRKYLNFAGPRPREISKALYYYYVVIIIHELGLRDKENWEFNLG